MIDDKENYKLVVAFVVFYISYVNILCSVVAVVGDFYFASFNCFIILFYYYFPTMDFNFMNGYREEKKIKDILLSVVKDYGIEVKEIIDVDVQIYLVSFSMSLNRYVRFYSRYNVFFLYKYDRPITEDEEAALLDIRVYRVDKEKHLVQCFGYEQYFRSLLLFFLPSYFQGLPYRYRVIFIDSYPPFVDESHEVINQDTNQAHQCNLLPLLPRVGFILLEINFIIYVCKLWNRSRNYNGINPTEDRYGFIETSKVALCTYLIAQTLDSFNRKENNWESLDQLLIGRVRKRNPITYNNKERNLNPYGICEDIRV